MSIFIGIVTIMVSTILFYQFLKYATRHGNGNRIECIIIENRKTKKLTSSQRVKIIAIANKYYTFLFSIAALISFSVSQLYVALLLSLLVFGVGFIVGYGYLLKYRKRITLK